MKPSRDFSRILAVSLLFWAALLLSILLICGHLAVS